MPSAAPLPPLPPFGQLGSTASPVPFPVGAVKLTRTLGDSVEYAAPPEALGQGLGHKRWERDVMAGPGVYALTLPAADLAAAEPLARWRTRLAADCPGGVVRRGSDGARRLAALARTLLDATTTLHANHWRLGLTGPDNLYVVERSPDKAEVFLPDLGAAWLGTIQLARPSWLKAEPADAALWNEDRFTRQLAAPSQYQKKIPDTAWPELVGRDLRLVGRLFRFALTGEAAVGPPGADKVWAALRDADAGKFADAEAFKKALLDALRAPIEPPGGNNGGKRIGVGKALAALAVLLLATAGGGWYWWEYLRPRPAEVVNVDPPPDDRPTPPTQKGGTLPTPKDGGKTAPSPPAGSLAAAEKAVRDAGNDMVKKGEAAERLARLDPRHELVAHTRAELLAEIQRNWKVAREGGHVPLASRGLMDAYKKLPDAP